MDIDALTSGVCSRHQNPYFKQLAKNPNLSEHGTRRNPLILPKARICAPFIFWHAPCNVFGVGRMARFDSKQKGRKTMFATDFTANKAFAAVFALTASAMAFAFTILPATPSGLLA